MKVFEEFDFEDEPEKIPDNTVQVAKLVERALKGEHNKWEFIRDVGEFQAAVIINRSTNKLVKGFIKSTRALYKEYNKAIKNDKTNVDLTLALYELSQTVAFYKEEIKIVDDMIAEFRAYAFSGHLIDLAMGYTRPEEDLYDHRKPKPTNM